MSSSPAARSTPPDVADGLRPFIDEGDLAGVVTLSWQHGHVLQVNAIGWRDLALRAPMQRDTLFRIASMSKPVTTVAALMLLEQGKLRLEDPIATWAPEFAAPRVLRDPKGPLEDTEPARRPITVEDLMTHRAGIGYAFTTEGPIAAALGALRPGGNERPEDWMAALGRLPLAAQPGEQMLYGLSTDVLGVIVERIAGMPLRDLLHSRVFEPLGMTDTDFFVPAEKRDRLATLYQPAAAGRGLEPVAMPVPEAPPVLASGGAGLVSTADDYLRFARMLLGDGALDDVRLLRPETVQAMRRNRLTPAQRAASFLGMPMWEGLGFGLGVSVVETPGANLFAVGSQGAFGWPGAWGTWWLADPERDLVLIYLVQHFIPLTPGAADQVFAGRGLAGRRALPVFQQLSYASLAG